MTQADQDRIPKLHASYEAMTGLKITLTLGRIFVWECFLAKGFTEADLARVVKFILKKIRLNQRRIESLRFDRLIQDVDRFEMDLAELNRDKALAEKAARPAKPLPQRQDGRPLPMAAAGVHTEVKAATLLDKETFSKGIEAMRKAIQ